MPETAIPVVPAEPSGMLEIPAVESAVPVTDPDEAYRLDEEFGKEHTLWAAKKVAENFIPFARPLGFLTQSGQKEFGAQGTGMKTLELGMDLVSVLPAALVSKSFRAVAHGLANQKLVPGLGRIFKNEPLPLETLDKIRGKLTPFVDQEPVDLLSRKYGLAQHEVEAWKAGNLDTYLLQTGFERSFELNKIVDWEHWNKTRSLKFVKEVEDDLSYLAKPREVREFDHYAKLYEGAIKRVLGESFMANKENREKTTRFVYEKFFSEEAAKGIDLASIDAGTYANIVYRLLDKRAVGSLQSQVGIGAGSIWPAKMQPVRFVFGAGDALFGTNRIYKTGVDGYRASMDFALNEVGKFQTILADKGLGKISKDIAGRIKFKFTGSKDDYHLAGEAIMERYGLARGGAELSQLQGQYLRQPEGVRKLMDAWEEWSDQLYVEHLRGRTSRVFEMAKLAKPGQARLFEVLEEGIIPKLERAFAPAEALNLKMKDLVVRDALKELRAFGEEAITKKWIKEESGELVRTALSVYDPTAKEAKGFPGYLDDIAKAIARRRGKDNWFVAKELTKSELAEFYRTARTGSLVDEMTTDLSQMVESRARTQGVDRFFYPAAKRIVDLAKHVPNDYKEYTAHWLFRMLGKPSPADRKLASWLQSSVGKVERLLNLKSGGLWNEGRVNDLAHNVNNLVYMGGLGFKPFSALRNFFQLPINVPSDLGGAKDLLWMVKGIGNAARKETRAEINAMGLIEEYAPELHIRATAIAAGKRFKLFGKSIDLPDIQQSRDLAMYMFKLSDRWIRYTTAGTALAKWDHFGKKFFDAVTGQVDKRFLGKMNISGRNKWVASELENLLKTGGADNFRKARELFTKDVVADTQYLYGVHESPIISHTAGAAGKMALVFQSWWMNYGVLLEKWMRTGSAGTKANRVFGFMLSCAISEQLMEGLWDRGTALRTVGFGPFPGEISEFAIPPAYGHIYHGLGAIISAGQLSPENAERHLKGLWRATTMFVPGGLQLSSSWKGATEEGFPGFAKSLIRYKPQEDYSPLWGLFHK
jgi:DNA-binding phage protein